MTHWSQLDIALRYLHGNKPRLPLSWMHSLRKNGLSHLLNEHRKRRFTCRIITKKKIHLPFNPEPRETLGILGHTWDQLRQYYTGYISKQQRHLHQHWWSELHFQISQPSPPYCALICTTELSQSTQTRSLSAEAKPKDVLQPLMSIQSTGSGYS